MRLISQLIISTVLLTSLGTIAAANTPLNGNDSSLSYHRSQFYVGASINAAFSTLKANQLGDHVNNPALGAFGNEITAINHGSPLIYDLELGYMTSEHFGIDLGYIYKPNKINMTIKNEFSGIEGHADLTLKMFTVGLMSDFQIQPKLSFIGKLGFALVQSYLDFDTKAQSITHTISENATQPTPMISLGLAYNLTRDFALTTNYMHIFEIKNVAQIDTTGFGKINSGIINPSLNNFGAGFRYYF